jgi:Terpene cyclase DEP1
MRPKHVYLGLCVVGTILPLAAFVPFLRDHGVDVDEFLTQLFATPVSGFFGWDVIVSSLVLWVFVFLEGRRLAMHRLWAPVAATLLVGVSLGLPLFLYMRERHREAAIGIDEPRG